MKLKFLLILFSFMNIVYLGAQEGLVSMTGEWQYGHCLKEVHFGGVNNTNYIPITKDDSSGDFLAPQFVKDYPNGCDGTTEGNIVEQEPVAYVSGTKARVKAHFLTDCDHTYYIRGLGPQISGGQIKFPSQQVTAQNGEVVYDWIDADNQFVANKIKYFEAFEIKWQISEDESNWIDIDESENELYVTHGARNVSLVPKVYHTLIDASCVNTNDMTGTSVTQTNAIVNKIFNPGFKIDSNGNFPGVKRKSDGHVITYYVNAPPGPNCAGSVPEMLLTGDGRCGAWAEFLKQSIRVHGILGSETGVIMPSGPFNSSATVPMTSTEIIRVYNAVNAAFPSHMGSNIFYTVNHFMVKHWSNVSLGNLIELPLAFNMADDIDGYETAKSDYGLPGIPGQGNVPDPRSIFVNHAVVFHVDKTYDPSYGSEFSGTGIVTLENQGLDATRGCIVRVQHSPTNARFYFFVSELNSPGQELQFISIP